jgi:hypothetical protein
LTHAFNHAGKFWTSVGLGITYVGVFRVQFGGDTPT